MADTNKTPLTFDTALKRFKSTTTSSMKYARICAEMALRHFSETGDTQYCQRFMDAMPKNYTRRAAFIKWLVAHSPAELVNGKIVKDKSDTANDFDMAGACDNPFWDFAPEKLILNYSAKDVIEAVERTLKRFENRKKYHPASDAASETVARLKATLATVQPANSQAA